MSCGFSWRKLVSLTPACCDVFDSQQVYSFRNLDFALHHLPSMEAAKSPLIYFCECVFCIKFRPFLQVCQVKNVGPKKTGACHSSLDCMFVQQIPLARSLELHVHGFCMEQRAAVLFLMYAMFCFRKGYTSQEAKVVILLPALFLFVTVRKKKKILWSNICQLKLAWSQVYLQRKIGKWQTDFHFERRKIFSCPRSWKPRLQGLLCFQISHQVMKIGLFIPHHIKVTKLWEQKLIWEMSPREKPPETNVCKLPQTRQLD